MPAPDAVELSLYTHRFTALAREMGDLLARTAVSTNVKERLDFSCALLDAAGELVVNAPHIPVHLGALGLCVRRLREVIPMEPGDVVVTNHPGFGGSHLPDVTVVTPVHEEGRLLGYVASRAHHAEIGGIRPGSMPPTATRLVEEGVEEAELEEARAYLLGREPFRRETARQWADLLIEAEHYGLPLDDPEQRKQELNALDEATVDAVARRHIFPDRLRVTVGMPRAAG